MPKSPIKKLRRSSASSAGEPITHSQEDQEEGKEIWGGEKSWGNS